MRAKPRVASYFPPVNIWIGEEGAMLSAELPGMDPDAIELGVSDTSVNIRGLVPDLDADAAVHVHERAVGPFNRTFDLPFVVDTDKVLASYRRGILALMLPRAVEGSPRRIPIKSA